MKTEYPQASDAALDPDAYEQQVARYCDYFAADDDARRRRRRDEYRTVVTDYYDLATDFYLWGWGDSFHFAPRRRGEGLKQSIERFEMRLAEQLQLRAEMQALDLGCGVAGPMRKIARRTGALITGVNTNEYQLAKARKFIERDGMADRCRLLHADFMHLPLPDATCPAVYSIEAIPYAPDKRALFSEVLRVLRPGGIFVGTDWCLTDKYRDDCEQHRRIRDDIELGNGLPALSAVKQVREDLEAAGFEIVWWDDLACDRESEVPWYWPLIGRPLFPMNWLASPWGRKLLRTLLSAGEALRVVPRGAATVQDFLCRGADALAAGGQSGIFTPLVCFSARKPQA